MVFPRTGTRHWTTIQILGNCTYFKTQCFDNTIMYILINSCVFSFLFMCCSWMYIMVSAAYFHFVYFIFQIVWDPFFFHERAWVFSKLNFKSSWTINIIICLQIWKIYIYIRFTLSIRKQWTILDFRTNSRLIVRLCFLLISLAYVHYFGNPDQVFWFICS